MGNGRIDLKIDPEFQGKIPPLTEAEFKQLEENILTAGEVYEPIAVWNGIIVDGHNRYKIIQKHPEIKWRTRDMLFDDKWEAFDWMYKNQLGRRNLTDEQRTYLLGKLGEARKHTHGGDRRSNNFSSSQNDGLKNGRSVEQIAREQHVGSKTVERAEHYAKGIDAIREVEPELADSILKAEKKVQKKDIQAIGRADAPEQKTMIEAIKSGTQVVTDKPEQVIHKPRTAYNGGGTSEYRKEMNEIAKTVATLYDTTPVQITIDDVVESIKMNAKPYIRMLTEMVKERIELCRLNQEIIFDTIDSICDDLQSIKEEITNV